MHSLHDIVLFLGCFALKGFIVYIGWFYSLYCRVRKTQNDAFHLGLYFNQSVHVCCLVSLLVLIP